MMRESKLERRFWRFWLGGLLILAVMIAMNPWFTNAVSPWGIRDHQSAGNALRVDAIQSAWQAAGVLNLARFGIALDLVYIGIYSFGAYCGGRLFAQSDWRPLAATWLGYRYRSGCGRDRRLCRNNMPICASYILQRRRYARGYGCYSTADKVDCLSRDFLWSASRVIPSTKDNARCLTEG